MTFQSRSHLIKHGTSHTRKTQVISAKINTFLESFSASLENDMLGLEDGFDGGEEKISANSEFDDHSVRLSVDTNPESLEAAAAEAAFAFGHHDLPEDLMGEMPMGSDGSIGQSGNNGSMILDAGGAPITGERLALQCDICQARLRNKSAYITHMKRHAGLLNFKCRLCPQTLKGQVSSHSHFHLNF